MEPTYLLAAEQLTVTPNALIGGWFTNSMLVTLIVTVLVVIWARRSTKKMTLIPNGVQNLFEAVVETLYVTFEGIVGKHMIPKVFSLLGTLFIFILAANWFGLVPGVGTIGFGEPGPGPLALKEMSHPLLRPANADLNMTLGMALFFMAWWLFWTIQEVGVIGFIKHIFAPKGDLKGVLWYVLLPLFIFVGIIEVISIAIRPVSLSFRLFGNIYAGETLLHTMSSVGASLPTPINWISLILFPLPFYFLELLVGLLQAFVFAMLCAVYIKLSTEHPEGDGAH
ncbi:MAG TPA: F0F1 ATP synthase subunit A [Chthoniobacterales bacterium]|jgi:F-type H+-transporting ATPase subunit a|nr:F0F1 ATP synthase subunit A [Chthoniobacterales bacterium]